MTDDARLLTERTRRLALEIIRERRAPISLEEFRRTNIVSPTWAAPILRALAQRGDLILVSGDRYALAPQHNSPTPDEVEPAEGPREVPTETPREIVASADPAAVPVTSDSPPIAQALAVAIDAISDLKPCRKCHVPRAPEYFIRAQSMRPDARVTTCGICLGLLPADGELEPAAQLGLEAPDKRLLPRERAALTMRAWKDRTGHSITITIQWRTVDRLARLEQRLLARAASHPTEVRHYAHLLATVAHRCGAFSDSLANGVRPGDLTLALFEALDPEESGS